MKMIIQNKHYFTTFLLTSGSKCNFRATNPALNCDLLSLNKLQILIIFINRVVTWSQCHPCPRGGIIAGNFLSSMPAAISGLGRLVKASLTIDAVSVNSRSTRLLEFSCIIISLGRQVKISLLNTRNV